MLDPNAVIDDFLSSHDLDYEQKDENTYLITLPGEAKQQTHCALVVGDHSLSINAFVIRKPDENKAAVFEYLLKKNADYGDAFATYGPIGVIVRMGDKIQRLVSVSKNGVSFVDNESLRDTLIDLHNYSAMAVMLIDEQAKNSNNDEN